MVGSSFGGQAGTAHGRIGQDGDRAACSAIRASSRDHSPATNSRTPGQRSARTPRRRPRPAVATTNGVPSHPRRSRIMRVPDDDGSVHRWGVGRQRGRHDPLPKARRAARRRGQRQVDARPAPGCSDRRAAIARRPMGSEASLLLIVKAAQGLAGEERQDLRRGLRSSSSIEVLQRTGQDVSEAKEPVSGSVTSPSSSGISSVSATSA